MNACVLIPAYNEAHRIAEVVARSLAACPHVLVVDDGSSDGTAALAEREGAVVIRHGRNQGKGQALRTGFAAAWERGFDAAITLDADGQHEPEDIPRFVAEAASDPRIGIVLGCRMSGTLGMPFVRLYTNRLTSAVVSAFAGQRIADSQCGFRLIRREVLQSVRLRTSRFDTESELLIEAGRKGWRIAEVPIRTIYGSERSKINALFDTLRFLRLAARYLLRI